MTNRTLLYFYPRSPCGERPAVTRAGQLQSIISIHALLAESDVSTKDKVLVENAFLSTLSLRRATQAVPAATPRAGHFYPRSPCGERPAFRFPGLHTITNFYPRSPCGERRVARILFGNIPLFLSTLSLRRATVGTIGQLQRHIDFYPRSPCGERRKGHALRLMPGVFLSTLSLRRATQMILDVVQSARISIHALLAESDYPNAVSHPRAADFYPRSPCGERLAVPDLGKRDIWISIHALLAESDAFRSPRIALMVGFLSTLSLRRATFRSPRIALMVGFLSTLSLRRATMEHLDCKHTKGFLSTLSLRRATWPH